LKYVLEPNQWVKNYAVQLLNVAKCRINELEDAQDTVQEVFLAAYKYRESFKGDCSEKTWLYSILKNKIIDYYKQKNKDAALEDTEDEHVDDVFFEENGHWKKEYAPKAFAADASSDSLKNELRQILDKCFEKLPAKLKALAKMKYQDDEDSDIICDALRISNANFWTSLHRSRLILRECIEKKLA